MKVEILTPEKSIYKGEATLVSLPGVDGGMGIMDNHAPLITTLKEGKLKLVQNGGKEELFDVKGGTVEVLNNKVVILAD